MQMTSLRFMLWQHGAEGVIARLIAVLFLGAIGLTAGVVNVALQAVASPFAHIQALCGRLLRGLRP
jgi:hypothetical protein